MPGIDAETKANLEVIFRKRNKGFSEQLQIANSKYVR